MSTHNPHRRAGLSGAATLIMLLVMLAAAASGALASRDDAGAFPVNRAVRDRSSQWSPADVRQLMAVIEESDRNGLEPERYGLSALRSELDQSTELWGRAGTHQLDVLAGTSALALANDYRARAGVRLATADDIRGALAAGQLRAWLTLRKD